MKLKTNSLQFFSIENYWFLFSLSALYIFSLLYNIHVLPLHFEEPRRALVAMEMAISGNYIVPKINGELYYNKLPFFNWVILLMYKMFGSFDNWVVRLPTVLSLVASSVVIFFLTKKWLNKNGAILAAFFWLTSLDIYYRFSLLGEIDIFFTLVVLSQVATIFHFYETRKYFLLFILSYLLMAVGFLTKGLPSIAVQGITLVVFAIVTKDYRRLFSLAHLTGIIAALGVLSLYFFLYVQHENVIPIILRQLSESSDRVANDGGSVNYVLHLLTFPVMLLKVIVPWGLGLIFLAKKEIRKRVFQNRLIGFSVIFIAFNIIPYWLSSGTNERYLYLFIPFTMIVCAQILVDYFQKEKLSKVLDVIFSAFIILLMIASAALPFIQLLEGIKHLILISIFFAGSFTVVFITFLKNKSIRVELFVVVLVMGRVLFDLVVIPGRMVEFEQNGLYSKEMEKVFEIIQGQPLKVVSGVKEFEYSLPFHVSGKYEEVKNPFFGISYLYSKKYDKVLTYADELNESEFYLGRSDYVNQNFKHITILYEFNISNWNEDYTLFRLKGQSKAGISE